MNLHEKDEFQFIKYSYPNWTSNNVLISQEALKYFKAQGNNYFSFYASS